MVLKHRMPCCPERLHVLGVCIMRYSGIYVGDGLRAAGDRACAARSTWTGSM